MQRYEFRFPVSKHERDEAYLELHHCLLKSRSRHSPFSGVLALRPNSRSVWCLHNPHFLGILYPLVNRRGSVWCLNWKLIALGDVWNNLGGVGVIDLLLVVCRVGIRSSHGHLSRSRELPYGP